MLLQEYMMIVIGYLSGSIPTGLIIFYLVKKDDIRNYGSGNMGATNVARSAGAVPGLISLIIDILKGFSPVFACTWIGISADSWTITIVAIAAIAGHMFPVWLGFRGGKGVATGLGVFLALAWHATLLALVVFVISFIITRIVSLSSIVATLSFIIFSFVLGSWLGITFNLQIGALLGGALVIIRHYENIGRLLTRSEKKLTLHSSSKKEE